MSGLVTYEVQSVFTAEASDSSASTEDEGGVTQSDATQISGEEKQSVKKGRA